MTAPRLYHLVVRRKDGAREYLTRYPMPHAECMTMKSKFLRRSSGAELLETTDARPLLRCRGCGDYHGNTEPQPCPEVS